MQTKYQATSRRSISSVPDVELMNEMNRRVVSSFADGVNQLMSVFMAPLVTAVSPARTAPTPTRKKHHLHDCGCGCDCERDMCHCQCCIGDVDIVVYARVGERRVISITIENSRRREKEIKLELSNWTTRSGKPSNVSATILAPTEFKLPPCSEHSVAIVVNALSSENISSDNPDARFPDVDECEVVFADLRVEGCDIRPIRIALALLPRDCETYDVECGCTCC
jgi:hypothetical protein